MRKIFIVFMTLLAVNLVSAQDYDKSYVKYKQKLIDGKWGTREPSESYIKFNLETFNIHIHDDYGLHLDVHEKITDVVVEPTMVGDWNKYVTTLIVDKDYNDGISVGTEIQFVIWTNTKTESAAYSIISKYGEVLYVIYKHEIINDGVIEKIINFKTY